MDERTIRIGRRKFTAAGVMALLSGVAVTVWGCGSTSSPSSPSPTTSGDITGTVSANHGHVATITAAQLTAGNAVTLHIQGNATHDHTVSLTASQIASAANRQQVSVTSSTDSAHSHVVTFN
jgi:hypothetical protein